MKLNAQVQLWPDEEQSTLLKETLERCNAACNAASDHAWQKKQFNVFALQKALYDTLRHGFGLGAQATIRAIGKVADGYKLDRTKKREFLEHGAFPYDDRLLKFRTIQRRVSIWTLSGRIDVPFACGERQAELLVHQHGECDLVHHHDEWYLLATCSIPDPSGEELERFLDLGQKTVKPGSDGNGNGDEAEFRKTGFSRDHGLLRTKGRS